MMVTFNARIVLQRMQQKLLRATLMGQLDRKRVYLCICTSRRSAGTAANVVGKGTCPQGHSVDQTDVPGRNNRGYENDQQ